MHTLVCTHTHTEAHEQQLVILGTEMGGDGSCVCGFGLVKFLLLKSTETLT